MLAIFNIQFKALSVRTFLFHSAYFKAKITKN